jgi:uncharacterized protein involved in exopolysaccharide biosynthesis
MPETGSKENGHDRERAVVQVPVQYVYAGDDDEISLLDLMAALARQKFLVFWITLVFLLGSIGVTFLLTPQYKTTAKVTSTIASGELVGLANSRMVQDAILDRFAPEDWREKTGLGKKWSRKELVSEYIGEMSAEEKDKNIVSIQVIYDDPRRAAEIANAYVEVLKGIFSERTVTTEAERRLYFSKELEKSLYRLSKAKQEFESFQAQWNVEAADSGFLEATARRAELRALLDSKNIQLRGLSLMASSTDPKIVELKEEIPAIREELEKLNGKSPESIRAETGGIPEEAVVEYIGKYYDMKYWEALHAALSNLYERSRMEEAINPAVIRTLEMAVPPENRFKPNRKLIVVLATLLGFFIAVFSAFVAEFARRASQDPEQEEKIRIIKEALNPMTYIRYIFRLKKE